VPGLTNLSLEGVGVTTTLVALIATATVADQAVVIAGKSNPNNSSNTKESTLTLDSSIPVSYLFRSLGVVVGISVSTALVQSSLRRSLEEVLEGENVAEVSGISFFLFLPNSTGATGIGLSSPFRSSRHAPSHELFLRIIYHSLITPSIQIIRRIRESLSYVDQLDPHTRVLVRGSYERALRVAFIFGAVLSVFTVICAAFIKERPLVRK
jgi:hypothetical protein